VLNSISQNQPRGLLKGEYLTSAREATFFGAPLSGTFLGSTDFITKAIAIVLIIFMSATTFTTQRQLMVKGMPKMDTSNNMMLQQQKIMLYLFPIIFAVTGVNFPIGVLIYWSTTNLWTWGQQYYVIKRNPAPGSPACKKRGQQKDYLMKKVRAQMAPQLLRSGQIKVANETNQNGIKSERRSASRYIAQISTKTIKS
jgi:YidC/Oxa1 family membrane protein insertase